VAGPDAKGTDLDEEGLALWPDRDEYYRDPNKGTIVFTGDLTLRVGDHTFNLLHTPGHTPGQIAVHVPEERVVFTGDTIFSGCQTWLMTSDVAQWLDALERIRTLDVDLIVPGHGPVVTKQYLDVQRSHLMEWKTAVATAIAKGWTREETVAGVSFTDRFGPVDVGQGYMLDYIQTWNAGSLYDKLTGAIPGS
jgi:cyclase